MNHLLDELLSKLRDAIALAKATKQTIDTLQTEIGQLLNDGDVYRFTWNGYLVDIKSRSAVWHVGFEKISTAAEIAGLLSQSREKVRLRIEAQFPPAELNELPL